MVSFSCEGCGDVLVKKKLDGHRNSCYNASFSCIDCMTHFAGNDYRSHTSCISEAQKYEGALYQGGKKKGRNNAPTQNRDSGSHNGKSFKAYVEDEAENATGQDPAESAPAKKTRKHKTATAEVPPTPPVVNPNGIPTAIPTAISTAALTTLPVTAVPTAVAQNGYPLGSSGATIVRSPPTRGSLAQVPIGLPGTAPMPANYNPYAYQQPTGVAEAVPISPYDLDTYPVSERKRKRHDLKAAAQASVNQAVAYPPAPAPPALHTGLSGNFGHLLHVQDQDYGLAPASPSKRTRHDTDLRHTQSERDSHRKRTTRRFQTEELEYVLPEEVSEQPRSSSKVGGFLGYVASKITSKKDRNREREQEQEPERKTQPKSKAANPIVFSVDATAEETRQLLKSVQDPLLAATAVRPASSSSRTNQSTSTTTRRSKKSSQSSRSNDSVSTPPIREKTKKESPTDTAQSGSDSEFASAQETSGSDESPKKEAKTSTGRRSRRDSRVLAEVTEKNRIRGDTCMKHAHRYRRSPSPGSLDSTGKTESARSTDGQRSQDRPANSDGTGNGLAGPLLTRLFPSATSRQESFADLVQKGPGSERGSSVNKILKRWHKIRADRWQQLDKADKEGRADSQSPLPNLLLCKADAEKELWKGIRLRKNAQGEIVLFIADP